MGIRVPPGALFYFVPMDDHTLWMKYALQEAQKAYSKGEVPVGAIIVYENKIIGKGHNLVETLQDPTAHAELLAITAAANALASWRLEDSTLYSTLEPCAMCAGAILLARIPCLVYAAEDPRFGACGSVVNIAQNDKFDVKIQIVRGIHASESLTLLKDFFSSIRERNDTF